MAVDVVTRIIIDRPRALVAEFSGDPSNAPRWYVNIKSVEWKTPPPVTIGTEVAFVAHFLGHRMAYTYKVLEYAPSQKLVMATAEGPFPMETTYTWESVGEDRTEMTLRNRGNPSGFSKLLSLFLVPAMRKANRKDLARLKSLMEQT
jgi:Polyketide cyclase / dehydrase and lipid transport